MHIHNFIEWVIDSITHSVIQIYTLSASYRKYSSRQSLVTGKFTINWYLKKEAEITLKQAYVINNLKAHGRSALKGLYAISKKSYLFGENERDFEFQKLTLAHYWKEQEHDWSGKSTHEGGPDKGTINQSISPSIQLPLSFLNLHWLARTHITCTLSTHHRNPPKARYMLFSQHAKHICRIFILHRIIHLCDTSISPATIWELFWWV